MTKFIQVFSLFALILLTGIAVPQSVSAGNPFRTIIRNSAKVADDVPIRAFDNAANPETRKMAREMVEQGRKLDDLTYSRRLAKEIETVIGAAPDPALVKTVRSMDDAGKETILLLSRGSQKIEKTIPDIAMRADFLKRLDGDTLCVLGRYDGLTDQAYLFQKSLDAGKIVSPKGVRAVTMDDFGAFFKKTGEKGVDFWQKTVKPNWKLWAAGGTLAAILVLPESYTDYVIETAADGAKKISRVAGKAIGETGSAASEGLWEIAKGFCVSTAGTVTLAIASVVFLIWFFSLALVRHTLSWLVARVRRIVRWLRRK